MPHGGKLIINADYDDMNKEINISFEDSGTGIKPENKDKILEPFFTTKAEGTGLGMALAYHVVTAHSGKIYVESEVNEGTKVTVKLPLNSENYI